MKPGDIILFKTNDASFKWQNGLYIVLDNNIKRKELSICKLNSEGKPELFEDGRFMRSVTNPIGNEHISKTNLKYKLPKDFEFS